MQTLYFDFNTKNIVPVLNVKQGDVGRKFKAVLTDGGGDYNIPAGSQFSVWFSGPGGEGNYSAIGDRSAFTVEGSTVIVELIAQMTVNAGTGAMCLVLSANDGTQLGLWNVIYTVEYVPGMGSEAAGSYYTALSELARQAIDAAATFETDTTLSVSGKAADSAAAGVALAGKAPAGYGLGGSGTSVLDLNTATGSGFYAWSSDSLNTPFSYGMGMTINRFDSRYVQLAFEPVMGHAYSQIAVRYGYNGEWYDWEWVNPPMIFGVEYRTTKRHNGKVVYTKRMNFGNLPASGSSSVATGIGSNKNLVSLTGLFRSDSYVEPYPIIGSAGDVSCMCWVSDSGALHTQVTKDCSSYTGEFTLEYIKD